VQWIKESVVLSKELLGPSILIFWFFAEEIAVKKFQGFGVCCWGAML
jgi:hypothetical protein